MIPALCIVAPLLPNCLPYTDETPSVRALERDRQRYDRRMVLLTGTVERLRQRHARDGFRYELFLLCDGRTCVRVYHPARSPVRDGETATVRGPYREAITAGRRTYYNEVEAVLVEPGS